MTRKEYFEYAENISKDIEEVYRLAYNKAIENNDQENIKWFGDRILRAINQRWINQYVPKGMITR